MVARKRILLRLGFPAVVVPSFLLSLYVATALPSRAHSPPSGFAVDPARLRSHVEVLSRQFHPRDYRRIWNLDRCADYIGEHFRKAGGAVSEQRYEVDGKIYRNVIASFGPAEGERLVVGAHYDACGETPGADDNASGIAGLVELAYLLGASGLRQPVELVAYTLEEPPFFRSGNMGSARHAYGLKQAGARVEAMICLEMIGCFKDADGSQRYPSLLLRLFYPDRGDFIAVVGSFGDRRLARRVKGAMRGATDLPVHAMCAPKGFPGLDYSDHRNYWNHGFTAVMLTDTAFLRNPNYHRPSDTADTLDFDRMAKVVLGVRQAVVALAGDEG